MSTRQAIKKLYDSIGDGIRRHWNLTNNAPTEIVLNADDWHDFCCLLQRHDDHKPTTLHGTPVVIDPKLCRSEFRVTGPFGATP